MKKITGFFVALAVVAMLPAPVLAQSEFDEFRERMGGDAATSQNAPAEDPLAGFQQVEEQQNPQGNAGNPLGAAGDLPVGALPNAFNPQTPEEMRAQMEMEAEMQKEKQRQQTFESAKETLMPMRPEEIRDLLDTFKDSREAAETPITEPEPKIDVVTLSLDPSVEPPTVLTSPGHITTLAILDSTGAPWPVQDVSWGGNFQVIPPAEGGHVIRITPMTAHGIGNMSILMVDLITPVTFKLRTGLQEVHYRLDARIPKNGPLAKVPLIEYGGLEAVAGADVDLTNVLEGTPPAHATKMAVKGVDGQTQAWKISGQLYLRTPLTLLSPAWNSSVSSADGMNVYTMRDTPVLLLSNNGRMVRASIAADEVTDE